MEKQLAVSTQLKNAKAEIAELAKKLESEIKTHNSNKETLERNRKDTQLLEAELEQLHSLLDSFTGALPRETAEACQNWPYTKLKFNAMTRLASWLASKHTI